MKPAALLLLLIVVFSRNTAAGHEDSTRVRVPDISYHSLDSLIRMNNFTAIFFWPGWCSACPQKVTALIKVLRQKKDITLISVNDPDSRPFLSKKLIDHPDVVKGYYRIQRHGRGKLISVNDQTQFRYFNWYFTGATGKTWPELIQRFLLFDRSGKLLYQNRTEFSLDSLATALAPYH